MALETKALRFPFAGHFTIIKQKDDGTDSSDPNDIYTSGRNIVDSVTETFSRTQEELNDGNSLFPAAVYPTGATNNVAIVVNTEDPDLDMYLKNATRVEGTDVPMWHTNLTRTISDAGTIALTDSTGTAVKVSDDPKFPVVVKDFKSSDPYTEAASASPEAGEYILDPANGTFTFNDADKGKMVMISCGLVSPEATIYVESSTPTSPTYRVIITGPAEDYTANNPMYVTKDFDSMQLSGDYSPLARQKGPGSKTITFQTTRPRACEAAKTTYSKRIIDDTVC